MKNIDHIKRLVQKAQDKSISKAELDELLQWLEDDEVTEHMPEICDLVGIEGVDSEIEYSSQWQKLSDKIEGEEADTAEIPSLGRYHRIPSIGRWVVAAVVLVLCSVVGVVMLKTSMHPESITKDFVAKNKEVITPGTKRAILITGNGNQIMLDSSSDKMIVQGKNFSIKTNEKGQLVNNSSGASEDGRINTVATPSGGQYEIILPDGTTATLNAASSISYPTAFPPDKREVKITGEVYFEVTRDPRAQFVVRTERNMQIGVLGTHFNVNAYSNEPSVKATLLEGAVRVTTDKVVQTLKPQEQAVLTDDGSLHLLKNVDVGSVIAWKNGVFEFNGADIKTVMREISRWYNVEIVYEGNVPADLFSAMINRQNNIDQVLTMLQNTLRVHFSIKNRTVYVSN